MGEVVARMPGIEKRGELDGLGAVLGVDEAAVPLLGREGLEEHDPAGVEAFDEFERPLDGGGRVVKLGPGFFVVGGDDGGNFGEGLANAQDGVHVGVGDVVGELADGPSAFAVGGGKLVFVEIVEGVAEELGEFREVCDRALEQGRAKRIAGGGAREAADGKARVGRLLRIGCHGLKRSTSVRVGRWRCIEPGRGCCDAGLDVWSRTVCGGDGGLQA